MAATVEQLSMTQQEMEVQKEQLVQEVSEYLDTTVELSHTTTVYLQVSYLRKQLLTEQEGRRADKLESDERVKIAQAEKG